MTKALIHLLEDLTPLDLTLSVDFTSYHCTENEGLDTGAYMGHTQTIAQVASD